MANPVNNSRLQELIAAAKQRAEEAKKAEEAKFLALNAVNNALETSNDPQPADQQLVGTDGMTFNARQTEAINVALSGASFCLIGAAGTGKTTAVRELCKQLVLQDKAPIMQEATKVLREGMPGIVCCSFTNVAVINIARNMQGAVACQTIHSLLEFEPHNYDLVQEDGSVKSTMRFEPARNRYNPLPSSLTTIVVEESSMVGTDLFNLLLDALPNPSRVQFIFLGDINQLPPVYDTAILGYKMLELPIIELTEVYRQALNSPIITLAHKVKEGKTLCEAELRSPACNVDAGKDGKLTVKPWKKKLDSFDACKIAGDFTKAAIDCGEFDPDRDMVLIPFNKEFGTLEFNRYIAQHMGNKRNTEVFEVIAGFEKYYLAVGDKVLVNKKFGVITRIAKNGSYFGMHPQPASTTLNRWGFETNRAAKHSAEDAATLDIDSLLTSTADIDDRKNQASHMIDVLLEGMESSTTLTTAGEVNNMLFAYALTVHKAQGSEWRKVYCFFHHKHNVMMCRELLYTAITRAREELVIVCEPNHFQKAVTTQRIAGNTLAEKAEYFKGKQANQQAVTEAESN